VSDDYGRLMDEEEKRLAPASRASSVDYGGLMDDQAEANRRRLAAVISQASGTNPDQFAKAKRDSAALGVPTAVGESLPDETAQRVLMQRVDDLIRTNPKLAERLSDPQFAKLTHDDLEGLSVLEKGVRLVGVSNASIWSGMLSKIPAGLYALGGAAAETVAPVLDPLSGRVLPENPLRRLAAGLRQMGQQSGATGDWMTGAFGKPQGVIESGVRSGFESLGQNLPPLAAGFATGNPALATGGMKKLLIIFGILLLLLGGEVAAP